MSFRDLLPSLSRQQELDRPASTDPFERLRAEMDRMFQDFLPAASGREGLSAKPFISPSVDVTESDTQYEVTADLPGMNEDDVEVTIKNGVLTIEGERKEEQKEEKDNYHRLERRYGSFCRRFTLPSDVEEDKVDAHFDKGVLKIVLPKSKEAVSNHRRIDIRKA